MKKFIFAVLLAIFASAVCVNNILASDIETATRNAYEKLKANHFLLADEINEI